MKFYKRDPDRALAGMNELSLRQRGAYNSLIDLLYSRDGNVPDDDKRVAGMIGVHWREWGTVKKELIELGKVWVEEGKLRAKRVQETIKEASDFSQEQRRRVSKRWNKSENHNEINYSTIPHGNTLTPTPTPREEEDKNNVQQSLFVQQPSDEGSDVWPPLPKKPVKTRNQEPEGFAEWYAVFPRHEARRDAAKAYRDALRRASKDVLLQGAKAYAELKRGSDFVKLPATWLRSDCWLDEQISHVEDKSHKHRLDWLTIWVHDGRWQPNASGNGIWTDPLGIGPPPHDPRTLVTDDDLDRVPGARSKRDVMREGTRSHATH